MTDVRRSHRSATALPRRPMLRPGLRVCRRPDGWLQVGLLPPTLRLPDTGELRGVLAGMRVGAELAPLNSLHPSTARACAELWGRGLLVDADQLLGALGRTTQAQHPQLVELLGRGGDVDAWRERGRARVEVRHRHLPVAADLALEQLAAAGLAVQADGAGAADLVVLLSGRVADRRDSDDLVRADRPHVFLTCVDGVLEVGPFVEPGATGCLRCADAERAMQDPALPVVMEEYLGAPPTVVPDPVPSDLLSLAVGLLCRDVVRWVDGDRPTTWSATVRVDHALDLVPRRVPRHPACGCGWDELYAV